MAMARALLLFLPEDKRIAAYYPIKNEADIYHPLNDKYHFLLPKTGEKGQMAFYEADDLKPGVFGIPEPQSCEEAIPDILLIPMVSFWGMNRMGYGGGYYDRFLAAHPDALRIGIAYEIQKEPFEIQPWDEPLDVIVTEKRIYLSLRNEAAQEAGKWLETLISHESDLEQEIVRMDGQGHQPR